MLLDRGQDELPDAQATAAVGADKAEGVLARRKRHGDRGGLLPLSYGVRDGEIDGGGFADGEFDARVVLHGHHPGGQRIGAGLGDLDIARDGAAAGEELMPPAEATEDLPRRAKRIQDAALGAVSFVVSKPSRSMELCRIPWSAQLPPGLTRIIISLRGAATSSGFGQHY